MFTNYKYLHRKGKISFLNDIVRLGWNIDLLWVDQSIYFILL